MSRPILLESHKVILELPTFKIWQWHTKSWCENKIRGLAEWQKRRGWDIMKVEKQNERAEFLQWFRFVNLSELLWLLSVGSIGATICGYVWWATSLLTNRHVHTLPNNLCKIVLPVSLALLTYHARPLSLSLFVFNFGSLLKLVIIIWTYAHSFLRNMINQNWLTWRDY